MNTLEVIIRNNSCSQSPQVVYIAVCLQYAPVGRKKRKADEDEDEVDGGAPLKKVKSPAEAKEEKALKVGTHLERFCCWVCVRPRAYHMHAQL